MIGDGRSVGERMIEDRRIPLVSFTGSTQAGRHVAEVVARRLGRSILELGGNNGIIVMDDANLDLASTRGSVRQPSARRASAAPPPGGCSCSAELRRA